jgi:hypothetical protein
VQPVTQGLHRASAKQWVLPTGPIQLLLLLLPGWQLCTSAFAVQQAAAAQHVQAAPADSRRKLLLAAAVLKQ